MMVTLQGLRGAACGIVGDFGFFVTLLLVESTCIIHSVVVRHVPVGVDCRASVMIF